MKALPVVLVAVMLAGCATQKPIEVTYDAARGLTTFETNRSLMGYRDMSGGLAGSQRVLWNAHASCPGAGCTPDEVVLMFYNDSNSELNIDTRRLQIVYDDVTYGWEDPAQTYRPDPRGVPRGRFFQVGVPAQDFAAIARAEDVRVVFGISGSGNFPISYERRAAFRTLADEMGLDD